MNPHFPHDKGNAYSPKRVHANSSSYERGSTGNYHVPVGSQRFQQVEIGPSINDVISPGNSNHDYGKAPMQDMSKDTSNNPYAMRGK